jgi:glycosyltransferase involved in cell wall biosynthesis
MRERSVRHLSLPAERTHVINPSPTAYLDEQPAKNYYNLKQFRITLLTGNEAHKNLGYFLRVCGVLCNSGIFNITFNITLSKTQLAEITPPDVSLESITNVNYLGKIPQHLLQEIYANTDLVMNLSELESFSNNYMEAWKMGLAQICSDRDFARHICRDSALYVEPRNPNDTAIKIVELMSNPMRLNCLAENGKQYLQELTSPQDFVLETLRFIERLPNKSTDNHQILDEHFVTKQ